MIRTLLALVTAGSGTAYLLFLARQILVHDHAGDQSYTHEWDMVVVPMHFSVALTLLLAGLGAWRAWSSGRTWALILASPLAAFVLYAALTIASRWLG